MSTNQQEFRSVPIAALTFSSTRAQTERRGRLDKGALKELAESIKAHGVMQPILVRPRYQVQVESTEGGRWYASIVNLAGNLNRQDPGHDTQEAAEVQAEKLRIQYGFEVVAGERRALASKLAEVAEIPALVRELTDEQVLELQLIENLQRQDLHELAEAEGYEALLGLGHTVDDMARKVGKSRGTIYARMKLLALVPDARKAFYEDKLNSSTALLLARIPTALQKQALGEITKPQGYGDDKSPMSVRQAQKHIHTNYMLRLSDAGFQTSDADLVPAAGACGVCPKRTGNQPELFGDVKGADVCTDPVCFKQKIAAHAERVIAEASAKGQKVITGKEAKKVAPNGIDNHYMPGFVKLSDRDHDAKGTFRQTLGKDYAPVLLQDPDTGKMIEVAPRADVDKAHGSKPARKENDPYRDQQRAEEKKRAFELAYRRALFLAIHAKKSDEAMPTLHDACIEFFKSLSADTQQLLAKALGWDAKNTKGAQGNYARHIEPKPFIDGMTLPDLYKLLRALTLAGELSFFTYGTKGTPRMDAAAKACGVNPGKVRSELKAAEQTKADAKKPAKAAAQKKPRAKK